MSDPAVRVDRFKALATGRRRVPRVALRDAALGRASYDLAMTLSRVEAGRDGAPAPPASRGFWARVFGGGDLPDDTARRCATPTRTPIDAAWLARRSDRPTCGCAASVSIKSRSGSGCSATWRGGRRDVLVAVRALPLPDADVDARAHRRSRARRSMRGRTPGGAARRARRQPRLRRAGAVPGALALVVRMAAVHDASTRPERRPGRTARRRAADRGRPLRRRDGAMAAGVGRRGRRARNHRTAVLAAMSGPPSATGRSRGRSPGKDSSYRLDLGVAERRPPSHVREKQEGLRSMCRSISRPRRARWPPTRSRSPTSNDPHETDRGHRRSAAPHRP